MMIESGRIVAIEPKGVWVDTIQRTTCSSCTAAKGCGQTLIMKWGRNTPYIWVLFEGRDPATYQLGDEIQIGVPDDVIVLGSLIMYLLPLLTLIIAMVFAQYLFKHDLITTLGAFVGLVIGGVMVRWYSQKTRFNGRFQPVLVDDVKSLHFYEAGE